MTEVTSVTLDGPLKTVHTSDMGDLSAYNVIVATGANARKLGLPNEAMLADKGIHYCAACDGMRFRGKTVAVVGGGNTALEDAALLARLCEKVYLIHRRGEYRADKIYADGLKGLDNIEPVITKEQLVELRSMLDSVFVDAALLRYIAAIVAQTRQSKAVFLGASPRASVAMLQASKAYALLQGRDFVTPDDIRFVCPSILQHRIILTAEAEMEGITPVKAVKRLVEKVEVPK
jgi:cation diffusion facilitator CzcD-associated flavoprotein CzcO